MDAFDYEAVSLDQKARFTKLRKFDSENPNMKMI
jgi:hypothetical protein